MKLKINSEITVYIPNDLEDVQYNEECNTIMLISKLKGFFSLPTFSFPEELCKYHCVENGLYIALVNHVHCSLIEFNGINDREKSKRVYEKIKEYLNSQIIIC